MFDLLCKGIAALASGIGSIFNWIGARQTLNNSLEMQKSQENQKQVAADDKIKEDVANNNTDATRKDLE